ncbi:MAG: alanine--tRNA ligase [Flavobacteriales bacterium]|nr:alanine--tRNA ligase [Flavobacteriales bacterium]
MNSKQVRQAFLDFFRSKGHIVVPSAPVVLKNDPTLMFTNAGMNQFKDIFLGLARPQNTRVANTQKCLRVSGKHNDLEDVGQDTYHHTFFEMLGNWSFGDYFKKEAIEWAWELLTNVYKINPDRLYVTYFQGDAEDNLGADQEARTYWLEFLSENRVLPGGKKDNFWEMGDTGPCGPCTEIHIDIRPDSERKEVLGEQLVNTGHPQVIELWNLVFIQYNRTATGALHVLPERHVDTGMGLERLCMVLQGKKSNYDTDLFSGYIFRLEELSGHLYGRDARKDVAFRAIADHVRAVGACIADGQLPSNTGAGYVVRRILRRAVRYGFSHLDFKEPFLYKLVEVLADNLGEAFPELRAQQAFVEKILFDEEEAFFRTLDRGMGRLTEALRQARSKVLDGATVFELYDTFGFPPDLTQLIAREEGFDTDMAGFEVALEAQRTRSRQATDVKQEDWVEVRPYEKPRFVGYDQLHTSTEILRYRRVEVNKKPQFQIVLNTTPFYAEGGGQVGDTGVLLAEKEKVNILDTIKENDLIIHIADRLPSDPTVQFEAVVDAERRQRTACNHSATHLLHAALRQVLGPHVEQRGSLVHPSYLRFDFSHPHKLSQEEIQRIEDLVNEKIRANLPRQEFRDMALDEALKEGAIALFGEKYGEKVRMIRFGDNFSTELCGGTHVAHTGEIGLFKIISESAIAAGVRRIEALTGMAALEYVRGLEQQLREIKNVLKGADDPVKQVMQLAAKVQALEKKLQQQREKELQQLKTSLQNQIIPGSSCSYAVCRCDGFTADELRSVAFMMKNSLQRSAILMAGITENKPIVALWLSDDLVQEGMNASHLVRTWARHIQGGGGGQPFFATAGGKKTEGIEALLDEARKFFAGWTPSPGK